MTQALQGIGRGVVHLRSATHHPARPISRLANGTIDVGGIEQRAEAAVANGGATKSQFIGEANNPVDARPQQQAIRGSLEGESITSSAPVDVVYGILQLGRSTDSIMLELRGHEPSEGGGAA